MNSNSTAGAKKEKNLENQETRFSNQWQIARMTTSRSNLICFKLCYK
jgi:hypothetical protein